MNEAGVREQAIRVSKARITLLLVAAVVAIHLLNIPALLLQHLWPDPRYNLYIVLFSVRGEGKLGTFYSGFTLLAAAALLGVIAKNERQSPFRRHWFWLAVVFALIALDEVLAIHDAVEGPIRRFLDIRGGPLYYAWVIPGIAFVVFMAVAYFRFWWTLPHPTRALLGIAAALYLGGALGMEMVGSSYVVDHGQNLTYGVMATFEEVLEMSGVITLLYALMDYLARHAPHQHVRFTD